MTLMDATHQSCLPVEECNDLAASFKDSALFLISRLKLGRSFHFQVMLFRHVRSVTSNRCDLKKVDDIIHKGSVGVCVVGLYE